MTGLGRAVRWADVRGAGPTARRIPAATASSRAVRRAHALMVLPICVLAVGCLDGISPIEVDYQECPPAVADTTTWERTEGSVSILLPEGFEQIETNYWERAGTRIRITVVVSGQPPFVPFETWNYVGSCSARASNGRRFVIDYGGVSSGGPTPDLGIAAAWRSVPLEGGSGDIILSATMRDHSDARIVEAAVWTMHARSGPGGL
jgi:hypothetical protein